MLSTLARALGLFRIDDAPDTPHEASARVEHRVIRDAHGRPHQDYFRALAESTDLPSEILSTVLDFAGVWYAAEVASFEGPIVRVTNGTLVVARTPTLYFTAHGTRSLRRVVFRMTSKDQGWSSNPRELHETFEGSYTWFDAFVLPNSPGQESTMAEGYQSFELQRNKHAGRKLESYEIVVSPGHPLFDLVSSDCSIGLRACAHFPGWVNNVSRASIELQFADTFDHDLPTFFVVHPGTGD